MRSDFNRFGQVVLAAVRERVVPGLVVAVGQAGRVDFLSAYGNRQIEPESEVATTETVYDLASLTKAMVTSLLVMHGVAEGILQLDRPLGDDLPLLAVSPSLGPACTLRRVLAHAAGFPAHRKFYEEILRAGPPTAESRSRVVALAAAEPLAYPPGAQSQYSDLGYILLGELLERRMAARLDVLAERLLWQPLGMVSTGFVDLTSGQASPVFRGHRVAPTERCPVRDRMLVGEVHDLNCYAMGGIAGHAGLFGTAGDILRLGFALCAAYRGSGIEGGKPMVDSEVLRLFWQPAGIAHSTWRLGWDGPAETDSLAGSLLSRRAVGHLSFTGCSLWIDPEQEVCVVVLCNRIHPAVRADPRFRALRPALHDAALQAIGYQAR